MGDHYKQLTCWNDSKHKTLAPWLFSKIVDPRETVYCPECGTTHRITHTANRS